MLAAAAARPSQSALLSMGTMMRPSQVFKGEKDLLDGGGGGGGGSSLRGGGSSLRAMEDTSGRMLEDAGQEVMEPNAIIIAINASSGDCVHHILHAVLEEKVRPEPEPMVDPISRTAPFSLLPCFSRPSPLDFPSWLLLAATHPFPLVARR